MLRNNVLFIAAIIVGSSIVHSCNSRHSEQRNLQKKFPGATAKPKFDCLEGRDTAFPNSDYLRFVSVGDTAFDLKVGIDGKEAFLGYTFGCGGPSGLIPRVLKHTASQIILVRGYGFHYRELVICDSRADSIHVQKFETELAIGAKYDAAYLTTNDPSRIVVIDLLNKKDIELPMRQSVKSIKLFQISENAVVVVDDKGQKLVIPFKK